MARLEALSKVLYYPTQLRVLGLALEHVTASLSYWSWKPDKVVDKTGEPVLREDGSAKTKRKTLSIVDPCCGEGVAAAYLAKWVEDQHLDNDKRFGDVVKVRVTGVELHEGRAEEAKSRLHTVHVGSTYAAIGDRFHVMLLNPPYADSSTGGRQEAEFLQHALPWLAPNGLLIYIVPERALEDTFTRNVLARGLRRMVTLSYPEPERSEFGQAVLLGIRGDGASQWEVAEGVKPAGVAGVGLDLPSAWRRKVSWAPDSSSRKATVSLTPFDPDKYEALPAYSTKAYKRLFPDAAADATRPLLAPRPGHLALLLAAGVLNGAELPGKLVKGRSTKSRSSLPSADGESIIERERVVSYISQLDLKTYEYETWEVGAEANADKTVEWFKENGPALAKCIDGLYQPMFDPATQLAKYTRTLAKLSPPGVLPGCSEPKFLDLQVVVAGAIASAFEYRKSARIAGEMGTGKTTMGVLAMEFWGSSRRKRASNTDLKVVILCPGHLVDKWLREIRKITGCVTNATTAKRIGEVAEFFSGPSRYLVLSKETAKLGARWDHAFVTRERKYKGHTADGKVEIRRVKTAVCPSCGADPIDEAVRKGIHGTAADFASKKLRCAACKEQLWSALPLSPKTRRWPLAAFIAKHYPAQFVLIQDEAHQYAAPDSDQSQAAGALAGQAVRVLEMTGTFYGGRASSVFYSLHRADPEFRAEYKFDDRQRFVEVHGLLERVYEQDKYTSKGGYARGVAGRVRELPGMTPQMIPQLLESTAFVKLKDLGHQLPPYSERVVLVPPHPAVKAAANKMQREVGDFILQNKKAGARLLGSMLQACLGYPDCPQHAESIIAKVPENPDVKDSPFVEIEVSSAPALDVECPKDEALANLVWECKEAGRGVAVYFSQVGARDARGRVKDKLEAEGLKVEVLDVSVSSKNREAWLNERVGTFDVLLTNGRLVETGLDLLWAHTIVQYGVEYNIHTLRQSSRRAWRLGQSKPCEFVFFGYEGTMQEQAIALIAKKMRAAEMIDGDDLGGLAEHDVDGGNMLVELAQQVFGELR